MTVGLEDNSEDMDEESDGDEENFDNEESDGDEENSDNKESDGDEEKHLMGSI